MREEALGWDRVMGPRNPRSLVLQGVILLLANSPGLMADWAQDKSRCSKAMTYAGAAWAPARTCLSLAPAFGLQLLLLAEIA